VVLDLFSALNHDILIVEPDPKSRWMMVKSLLEHRGDIEVTCLGDGREALKKLGQGNRRWSLVICDAKAFRVNGFGMLQSMRDNPDIGVISFLMLADKSEWVNFVGQKAKEVGADGFLMKPFSRPSFLSKVDELLRYSTIRDGRHVLFTGHEQAPINEMVSLLGNMSLASVQMATQEKDIKQLLYEGPICDATDWKKNLRREWGIWIDFVSPDVKDPQELLRKRLALLNEVAPFKLPILLVHEQEKFQLEASSHHQNEDERDFTSNLVEALRWPTEKKRFFAALSRLFRQWDLKWYRAQALLNEAKKAYKNRDPQRALDYMERLELIPDELSYRILRAKILFDEENWSKGVIELQLGIKKLEDIKGRKTASYYSKKKGVPISSDELSKLVELVELNTFACQKLEWTQKALNVIQRASQICPNQIRFSRMRAGLEDIELLKKKRERARKKAS
jgi:CheY-like chemotaxis protein